MLETADGVEVTDGNGDVDDVRRRRHRHPPRPGAGDAGRAHAALQREVLGALPYSRQHRPAAHRHLAAARTPRAPGRRGTSCAPRDAAPGQVTVTYDLTRLQRLPTPTRATWSPSAARDRDRPGHGHRPDGVRAPALHPGVGRRAAPAARDRHRPGRLRRRLPRLGLPRGRRALGRSRPPSASGCDVGPSGRAAAASRALDRRRLRDHDHATPAVRRSSARFAHRSPHLAGRPRRPARPRRARRASRPATTSATRTARSARTSSAFLAAHGVDLRRRPGPDGRARARLRLLLQPDQRLLVLRPRRASSPASSSRCTTPTATGTPTSCTPTPRAGPRTDKQMYVSPFHGIDGHYELAVPGARRAAARRRHPAHRRRRGRSAPRSPGRPGGDRATVARRPRRPAPARCSSAPTASGCGPAGCRSAPARAPTAGRRA